MKNYYADFLQTKNFGNMQGKAVSKVSKGQNQTSKQAFDTFDTALPSVNRKIEISAVSLKRKLPITDKTKIKTQIVRSEKLSANSALSYDVSAESAPTFTQRLNAMIAVGVSFDVEPDSFQAFGVSEQENIFLRDNSATILCTLHQSALMKYLSVSDLQMFKDEINERTAILCDGASVEPPFEVVVEIARDWFVDVLEAMAKR